MNTMNTTINSIPITSRIAVYHLIAPEDSEETSVLMSDGIREMIPANRIIEMPLPMPNWSICSPIHIRKDAPAMKVTTMTRPARKPVSLSRL